MTQGIQAAFERDAAKINFVGEGGLLHDAADEVVGDEVHAQFAFDHVGGLTTQDVHVEMNFDLAEMKLDAPAAKVEVGKVRFEKRRGQALPIDMSNFLTSFLMCGRPAAAQQYRLSRLGSPMCRFFESQPLVIIVPFRIKLASATFSVLPLAV